MIVGNGKMLAAVEDFKITKFFWPTVNNFQNMAESRLGVFSFEDNSISWLDGWKSKQQYAENSAILETTAKNGRLTVSVKDFVLPLENCLVRMISASEPSVIYCYTKTQLGESQKKDSVVFEGGMLHRNKDVALCVFSPDDVKEHDVGDIDFNSPQERNSGDSASIMSFFTTPDKETGTHKITIFAAISNSVKNVNRIMTGALNVEPSKWLYKTRFHWEKWLEKSKLTDPKGQRALLNMKMLMDEKHGGFASSTSARYSWIRDGVYAAYAFDLAGYHPEAGKFYSWLKTALPRHKYLLFADGTATNNNEKRTDQLSTAVWGIHSHYLKTKDDKFLDSMWGTIRCAAEELQKNFNLKTGLMSPSMTPWEDGFNVNAYTAASSYSAFNAAADAARRLGHENLAQEWSALSEKLRESYVFMCSDETYHRAYNEKNVDAYMLSLLVPFGMVDSWGEKTGKTVEKIEKSLWDNGLKRNPDSKNICFISTAWLAWAHKKSGNIKKYRIIMDLINENFTPLGMPSTSAKNDVSLWPNAMYVIARMD
ncbi:MAG: hypothetical protein HY517_02095 [Candidatus Aenigmarchaeota archaeon]|nr:hypothetical protein [Candidatus Aenigmarchaeota archaeon]